ncbi:MAG: hypothetical protein Q9160_003941 [Pyrenula sp. 1 TL-2023]
MDPLSVTASISGILALSITTCQGLANYYSRWKDADSDVAAFMTSANSLTNTLRYLERYLGEARVEEGLKVELRDSLSACTEATKRLQKKLSKVQASFEPKRASFVESQLRRSLYPFKRGTLIRLKEIVEDLRQNLTIILECLQLNQSFPELERLDQIDHNVTFIKSIASQQLSTELQKWLNPPNFKRVHDEVVTLREPGTGEWVLSSREFGDWLHLQTASSLLWLQGDTGCGKTILCSAIIEVTKEHCAQQPDRLLAYYYFNYDVKGERAIEGLLRALVKQLASGNDRCSSHLFGLWDECDTGTRQPSLSELMRIVNEMLAMLKESYVYIVIDGLDECQDLDQLSFVLQSLITSSKRVGCIIHRFILLSRSRKALQTNLDSLEPNVLRIEGPQVDADIGRYVTSRLINDHWWSRWTDDVRAHVQATLINKAKGMFQWVKCQLEALKKSKNLLMLQKCLRELPITIEFTYERSLGEIDPLYFEYSFRMLQWLCFSIRPTTVDEMNDILATQIGPNSRFEPENRFPDPDDIQDLCPGLVTVSLDYEYSRRHPMIKLSHSSVRDYLLSGRLPPLVAKYSIIETQSQNMIASACLVYLLSFRKPMSLSIEDIKDHFPLARYAAEHWMEHIRLALGSLEILTSTELSGGGEGERLDPEVSKLRDLVRKVLVPVEPSKVHRDDSLSDASRSNPAFENLICQNLVQETARRLQGVSLDTDDSSEPASFPEVNIPGPIATTTTSGRDTKFNDDWARDDIVWIPGLRRAIEADNQEDVDSILQTLLSDAKTSMKLIERLEVFIRTGKNEVVQKIMRHIDSICPDQVKSICSSALVAAVQSSNGTAIDSLLSYDLDPNIRLQNLSGEDDTALAAAIVHADPTSLHKLIQKGANVNQRTHRGKTPLFLATRYGARPEAVEIVETLLKAGAYVNARSSEGRTALHIAYQPEIVRILLAQKDSLVHMNDDRGISAFDSALARGADWKVAALLERDPSLTSHHTSSIANLWKVEISFLKHILDTVDVNVDAMDSYGDTLLTKVTETMDVEKVELLLSHGADATKFGRNTFGAAHIAALYNNFALLEIFSNHQIPVSPPPPRTRTALHVAAESDDELFLEECILRCDAVVFSMQDETGQTPLHRAIECFNTYALRRLGRRTRPNVFDDKGRHPVSLAKQSGNKFHVSFLEMIGFTDQGEVK